MTDEGALSARRLSGETEADSPSSEPLTRPTSAAERPSVARRRRQQSDGPNIVRENVHPASRLHTD